MDVICTHCGGNQATIHARRRNVSGDKTRYKCKTCGKTFVPQPYTEDSTSSYLDTDGYRSEACDLSEHEIPTEEYVRKKFHIDDSWICTHKRGNVWPSGNKQMHHGRYNFIPSKPIKCEWPVVRPVQMKQMHMDRGVVSGRKIKRAIIASDAQIGFFRDFDTYKVSTLHDVRSFDLLTRAITTIRPDVLILNGDMLDLPDWSDHFVQGPEFAFSTQLSINWFAAWLRHIRPYCNEVIYLFGNHEERMARNVINNVKSAYRLKPANTPEAPPALSIESLLSLDRMNIKYVSEWPQGSWWINSNLKVIHGVKVGSKSGQTVMKMLDGARTSIIQGHVHRAEQAHVTVHGRGKTVTYGAYSLGCLCRIDGVVPGSKGSDNWQQGFAVVDYTDDLFQYQAVNIWGGTMLLDGKEYSTEKQNVPLTDSAVSDILMGVADD